MQKNRNLLGVILCVFFTSVSAWSQALVPSDATYWTKSSPFIQYIYPRERESALDDLDHYMQFFKSKYDQSFAWRLDEKVKLSLASNQNQIANGFATVVPFLQTMHYPTGAQLLDSFAQDSFMFALTSHETAHLYQLSPKSQLSSIVKSVLGNTDYVMTPFIIPIFVFPNAHLPGFMLEGNAVMNESVVGHGGRLWSGEVRAQVLAQVAANKIGPTRLINENAEYPLQEDYHYGGYFFAYLAERFGVDKTNQFYIYHAQRDFWPFNMNKTFRRHFGVSYTRLIHDFDRSLKTMADRQQQAQGQVLARTFNRPHFNHDEKHIYFVGNPTGRLDNQLFQFHFADQKLTKKSSSLPSAKAFLIDGQYYVVSAEKINASNIKYALFGDALNPKEGTVDSIYQDIRDGHSLTVDANNSYLHTSLLKDGQFLDEAGTSAVLDDVGRAYYFRQAGNEHILYRDREPLFKYKGYYGFPMEVTSNGEIYFIASTAYGASLFRWHNNQIDRVLKADNVVDARKAGDNLFLVAANDSEGYQIRLVHGEAQVELPAWYDYKLPNQMPPPPPNPAIPSVALKEVEKEYSSIGQMRYSRAQIQILDSGGLISAEFVDPLWWSKLFIAARVEPGDKDFALMYSNKRSRLGWQLTTTYGDHQRYLLYGKTYQQQQFHGFLGLTYDLFTWRRFEGIFVIGPTYKHENTYSDRYGGMTTMEVHYRRIDGALAYEPYRSFSTKLSHETEASVKTQRKANSTNAIKTNVGGDVFKQTFFNLSGAWAVAEIDSIAVSYLKDDLAEEFALANYLADGEVKEVRSFTAKLKQVVDWSFYFPRFPLSLRRLAPFVMFRDTYTRKNRISRDFPVWREELAFGTEFEILIFHNIATRLAISYSTIKLGGSIANEWQGTWGLSRSF